ncbi:hypothetical protein AB0M91_32360 [Micromonospora rifamycinica]|uniref:hypothetical protein n=1 Tax=Micromonospora rifamycinica TaxID=291594 RepID=UPI003447D313
MVAVVDRPVVMFPPRRRELGRWLPPWLTPARSRPAAPDSGEGVGSEADLWGYAIRREWPDGAHDLFGFTPRADVALRRLDRDRGYWRGGPVRPTAVLLVTASADEVVAHPVRGCRKSSCPDSLQWGQR